MNIDQMPAGREMDALVAEKVMGWKRHNAHGDSWELPSGVHYVLKNESFAAQVDPSPILPKFSTDIGHAWEALDKAFPVGPNDKSGFPGLIHRSGDWCFTLFYSNGEPMLQTDGSRLLLAKADTAPLAICRAALKAVGV